MIHKFFLPFVRCRKLLMLLFLWDVSVAIRFCCSLAFTYTLFCIIGCYIRGKKQRNVPLLNEEFDTLHRLGWRLCRLLSLLPFGFDVFWSSPISSHWIDTASKLIHKFGRKICHLQNDGQTNLTENITTTFLRSVFTQLCTKARRWMNE